jgi:hypothetical protein
MKANIQVSDRKEADAIRAGLDDPAVRAFVVIVGILLPLSDRARKRVMTYVTDRLEEQDEVRAEAAGNGQQATA